MINCIPDMDRLFESLALMTAPGAHFFALILGSSFKNRFESNLCDSLRSLFTGETVAWDIYYKEEHHNRYVFGLRHTNVTLARIIETTDIPANWFSN